MKRPSPTFFSKAIALTIISIVMAIGLFAVAFAGYIAYIHTAQLLEKM